MAWLRSEEARRTAAGAVRRAGITAEVAVDDVMADALAAVWLRARSGSQAIDNPAAYGTAVIRNRVRSLLRGRSGPDTVGVGDQQIEVAADSYDRSAGDDLRVRIERDVDPRAPWLTSALLTYLTLIMHPAAVPDDAPTPQAGSSSDQARCWPALWVAGERDLFPVDGADPRKRTRARRIAHVLDQWSRVLAAHTVAGPVAGGGHGDG